jgi:hypothetical protein
MTDEEQDKAIMPLVDASITINGNTSNYLCLIVGKAAYCFELQTWYTLSQLKDISTDIDKYGTEHLAQAQSIRESNRRLVK